MSQKRSILRRALPGPTPISTEAFFVGALSGEIVEVLGGTILTDAQVQAMIDGGQRYDGIGLGPDRNLLLDPSWAGIHGNHSRDPNLWMQDAVTISSRREVAPGEELTIDYALFTANPSGRCLVAAAAGGVAASSPGMTGAVATSRRYRSHFVPFITELIKQQVGNPGHPQPRPGRA